MNGSRIHHKVARWTDIWGKKPPFFAPLCFYAHPSQQAKKPYMHQEWSKVTCDKCFSCQANGVPDGFKAELKLVKSE